MRGFALAAATEVSTAAMLSPARLLSAGDASRDWGERRAAKFHEGANCGKFGRRRALSRRNLWRSSGVFFG